MEKLCKITAAFVLFICIYISECDSKQWKPEEVAKKTLSAGKELS